jgi:hypothetical protein
MWLPLLIHTLMSTPISIRQLSLPMWLSHLKNSFITMCLGQD